MSQTSEKHQSLWLLTASPLIWAAHFLLCYATASIWCAKVVGPGGSLTMVRVAIAVYSALALTGIGVVGWIGYRRHSFGHPELGAGPALGAGLPTPPHDADTPEDRHRFLGFATLLLSALSAVAVLYAGLVALFFGMCY